jgi:hypothetical protein
MEEPRPIEPPRTVAEILDLVDWVREELTIIQRALERLTVAESDEDGTQK